MLSLQGIHRGSMKGTHRDRTAIGPLSHFAGLIAERPRMNQRFTSRDVQ